MVSGMKTHTVHETGMPFGMFWRGTHTTLLSASDLAIVLPTITPAIFLSSSL